MERSLLEIGGPRFYFDRYVIARRRIVKLARSARDKTLKSHVARYEIERTMWPGKRMNRWRNNVAQNRESIQWKELIAINGND